MILDTTSKVLEIILGGAKTTNDCEFTADYVDTQSGTTFAPAGTIGLSNGATLVTAVAAPAASTQRAVRAFTFYNADTVNTTVTVRIFDGTNRRRIIVMTLTPGQSLVFTPEAGWAVLPSTNGQIPGTTTNDSATAGNDGEFVESIVTNAAPVTFTTSGTPQNLTSISLTPGDWNVSGIISFNPTVSTSATVAAISLVTNTMPAAERQVNNGAVAPGRNGNPIPSQRQSLVATTTIFAVANASFATGTCTMYGFLNARRAR